MRILVTGAAGLRLAADAVLDLWQRDEGDPSELAGDRVAARRELRIASERVNGWYRELAASLVEGGPVSEPLEHDLQVGDYPTREAAVQASAVLDELAHPDHPRANLAYALDAHGFDALGRTARPPFGVATVSSSSAPALSTHCSISSGMNRSRRVPPMRR